MEQQRRPERLPGQQEREDRAASVYVTAVATSSSKPNEADNWDALDCGPSCDEYATAYDWLGKVVLGGAPYRAIEASHPNGFSDGFGDFVHDAIPGH